MSGNKSKPDCQDQANLGDETVEEFVTMTINGQLFGIPVTQVQDVLGPQHINCIPLAPSEVAGSLNLRGRIVTAIDVRRRLGLPPRPESDKGMSVVVDLGNELYSLIIDSVGEVLSLSSAYYQRNPSNLDPLWREIATGIYQLEEKLLVVLDIDRLMAFGHADAA